MKKILIYIILIIVFNIINAESKDMKIIFFGIGEGRSVAGKILYEKKFEELKHIWPREDLVKDKSRWNYFNPIFYNNGYIVIKEYRQWGNKPAYSIYSILLVDKNFKVKDELYKIHDREIFYISLNRSKNILAFIEQEKDGKDWMIVKKSYLNVCDITNKKIIFTKEIGNYLDEIQITIRALNSTGTFICFGRASKKILDGKGFDMGIGVREADVVLYDFSNDKEYIISQGRFPSFVTDNTIAYCYKESLYLYDITTKKSEKYFSSTLLDYIKYYFISPDNKKIIISFENKYMAASLPKLVLYNFETKQKIQWNLLKEIDPYIGHLDWQFEKE